MVFSVMYGRVVHLVYNTAGMSDTRSWCWHEITYEIFLSTYKSYLYVWTRYNENVVDFEPVCM